MSRKKGGKPGNPSWVKGGPSPNPGGRPPGPIRLRERYKQDEGDDVLYDRLIGIVRTGEDGDSIKAAQVLLERVYGKVDESDPERCELERDTLRAKLDLLKAGVDPDGQTVNVLIGENLKRDGE